MPPSLLKELLTVMPRARFLHSFGMTETVSSCTMLPDQLAASRNAAAANKFNSIGRAMLGSEISIRDPADQRYGAGTIGEIVVRGACVMRGYWNKPDVDRPDTCAAAGCTPAILAISMRTAFSS